MKIKREKNADGTFIVGNAFVEKFLKTLSGNAVKVYLYLKYAENAGTDISIAGVSLAAGIPQKETEDAVKEILAAGLVYFDEAGDRSLVITSDTNLKSARDRYLDNRYLKRLGDRSSSGKDEYAEVRKSINDEFFGGNMNQSWYNNLEKIEKEYAFSPETVYLLFKYCSTRVDDIKMKSRYVLKVAEAWHAEKIITPEDVEKKLKDDSANRTYISSVRKLMGYSRPFTQEESSVITSWKNDGITEGMLAVFLSDTGRVSAYTVKSISDEIATWKQNGLASEEAIRDYYAKQRNKKRTGGLDGYLDGLGTLMGIRRPFTKAEKDSVLSWYERGVTEDMLKVLLGDTGRVGAFTVAKIGAEVDIWTREGLKDASDVRRYYEDAAQKKAIRTGSEAGAAGAYGSGRKTPKRTDTRHFDNERQYDDDFFRQLENKDINYSEYSGSSENKGSGDAENK